MRSIVRFIFIAFLTFANNSAFSESLQGVIELTLKTNSQIKAAHQNLRSQSEGLNQLLAQKLPNISANLDGTRLWDLKNNEDLDKFSAGLTLSYTLFDGQLTNNKIIAENYRLESLKAEVASIEEKVIFDSIVAYLNVLRDIRLVELSAKNVSVLGRQLNAASSRFELGELTLTDVAQGTAALEAAKSVMAAREGALNLSNSIFEMAVGKKPTNLNQIIMLPKLPKSLNEAKILAAKSNADVRSILFLEQRARALWDVSKSKSLPSVGLSMSYSAGENYSNFDFSELGFRISGSIPIYNGGSLKSGEKEAFLALESIMARSELVRLNVAQEVMSAWSTFEVSSAVISARTRQVEASELAFKGTAEEARLGARTILDVLNAEQALMNTKTDLETAQSDRLAAAYRLLLATGTLTPLSLGLVSAIDN